MKESHTPTIVFLCGAINAGKSTVGKMLSQRLRAAFIEGDAIRAFIPEVPLEEAIPLTVSGVAAVVRSCAERGLSVVAAWPLRKEDHQVLLLALKDLDVNIFTFALNPSLEVALTNRGTRELTEWEIGRNRELYDMGLNNPEFATVLDNTNETPEETLERIYGHLGVK